MSLNAEERQKGIQPLTKDNYLIWIEMVKDYILAMDCDNAEDMWDAFEWDREAAVLAAEVAAAQAGGDAVPAPVVDPADAFNALPAGNAAQRKLKQQHAKSFAFIRRSLSPPIFEKTLGHRTNVPMLLRTMYAEELLERQYDARSRPHAHPVRQHEALGLHRHGRVRHCFQQPSACHAQPRHGTGRAR